MAALRLEEILTVEEIAICKDLSFNVEQRIHELRVSDLKYLGTVLFYPHIEDMQLTTSLVLDLLFNRVNELPPIKLKGKDKNGNVKFKRKYIFNG
mgnify:CR=1 FL=1